MNSPIVFVVLLGIFIFMLDVAWNIRGRSAVSQDRLAQAQSAFQELEKRHDDMSQKVGYLSTDQGIESEIRTKFRAAEKGESVAVIVDQKTDEVPSTTLLEPRLSWWQKMLRYVGL